MNERIREFAEQVYGSQATEQEIKLAKLIVRECMDVVAKKCASPTAYNALAEHWKVKE